MANTRYSKFISFSVSFVITILQKYDYTVKFIRDSIHDFLLVLRSTENAGTEKCETGAGAKFAAVENAGPMFDENGAFFPRHPHFCFIRISLRSLVHENQDN